MNHDILDSDTPSTRSCTICKQEKPLQMFEVHTKEGHRRNICMECDKKRRKAYYEKNKDRILIRLRANHKHYYAEHREEILAKYRAKHGGTVRGTFIPYIPKIKSTPEPQPVFLYIDNQQVMFDNCRHRRKSHQQQTLAPLITSFICQDCLNRIKKSRELRAIQKIKINLRHRLKKIIKTIQKKTKITICKRSEMLGCSATDFKRHIESQFKTGMSWENYGKEWHIDHIRPCVAFDLNKVEEQIKMNNYTNLQPLWAIENMMKGDTYDTEIF